jgi:hypothetical protein
MPFELPNNINSGPIVTPWVTTNNDMFPGESVYTELAKSFLPLVGLTPLTNLFPEEEIYERIVVIEQTFESTSTIFPLVEFGKPDVVLGHEYGTTRRMMVQPLYIRRSSFMSYGAMNTRIKPNTTGERWSQEEQIAMVMESMVKQHNLTWDVYRAQMLLGGISYTDPRSGIGVSVSSQIPAHNLWSYNTVSGYKGRNEANIFRGIIDDNTPEPNNQGVPWTNPDADIVGCVQRFAMWFKDTNKSRITKIYMSPELKFVLMSNNQVKMAMNAVVPRLGAKTGDRFIFENGTGGTVDYADYQGVAGINVGAEGLMSIAGIPIETVETQFKDPVDMMFKRVWPKNKVVFVSEVDPQGAAEAIGRTQYCVSEESGGAPGLWTRTQTQTQIPAAPGMYIQMGNAGLPYLKFPYRVAHMTVASVTDINNRIGVLGDVQFGQV